MGLKKWVEGRDSDWVFTGGRVEMEMEMEMEIGSGARWRLDGVCQRWGRAKIRVRRR